MGPEINRLRDNVFFLLVVAKSAFCIIPHTQLLSSFLIARALVNKKQSVFVKPGCYVQSCSKRMGRLVVVTNLSFYERFTIVNSMRLKAMQC